MHNIGDILSIVRLPISVVTFKGHSRSLVMALFDTPLTISY